MVDVALSTAQWVVAKALAPVVDGVLGAWADSRNFGLNIEALSTELLLVKATLENAGRKELGGQAMEELLQRLRDSAHGAQDLLDELDYFRIHDKLHGTYDAADQHGGGGIHDLALDARHTAKAIGKLVNYCPWQHAKHRQRSHSGSSSVPDTNQEVSGCMPKLGKLLCCSSSPHPHVRGDDCGKSQETPKFEFNRVDFSQRMKDIVEKLRLMRSEVNKLLQGCDPRIVLNIAQSRPITKGRIDEPKLYGRDLVMNRIIHDITYGQYYDKGLTVIPVVGPGGIGKTTLIQHIYHSQQVQNHFPVMIWVCVSLSFNLDKVLEQIKTCAPAVEKEKSGSATEDLIEQRLKSKRFLLVLDDIWKIGNGDDWGKLLSTLNKSEEKGSMILVTTRFQAIAQKVETTGPSIKLNGLESEEFRKLFLAFVFGDEQYPREKHFLLETGDKIMEKLKGSPLAAKTVGRLLSKDLSLRHWKRVLKSKGWEKQTGDNEIMPALKLSYDFLPFHLQQCFAYSGLFPEDYNFRSDELISLWIGLDIVIPNGQNHTFEDIGLSNLNELVTHGFFREEETMYGLRYVMHDLLHDLSLKVASHDCLSLCLSDVGPIEIQPSIRHLSISIDDLGEYDAVSGEKLKSKLEELKTRFKAEHLQTLMLFGKMDEGFVKIFGEFFGGVNALRILHLTSMLCPVESILHNFSVLVHLRYLCLGTSKSQMHLPLNISKFYHLRILDLTWWNGSRDLPDDMSNLAKLCHFYVPTDDQLHFDIYNVGKLKLLEELEVFQVNKKSEGFEPKQLEHLTKLRELGIYNLEKINTAEEAARAKLMEKTYLRRLTLDWDSKRSTVEPGVEAAVLESLQPHGDLQVLCIRGHRGPSCPTWLNDEFAVEGLQSLHLDGVSWEVFPSLGKAWDLRELRFEHISRPKDFIVEKSFCMLTQLILIGLGSFEKWVYTGEQESSVGGDLLPPTAHMFPLLQVLVIKECSKLLGLPFSNHIVSPDWFPKLQELDVHDCHEFLPLIPISWIESLLSVTMEYVKMLKEFAYSKSSNGAELKIIGGADLHSIDQVLVFYKETSLEKLTLSRCPPLELKHLLMLTSLRTLIVGNSVGLVGPLGGGQSDVEWQLPVEYIKINDLNGNTGKELTELLPHLPKLSTLEIWNCKNMKKAVVGVDVPQTTQEASEMGRGEITAAAAEEEDDGVLLFPAHLCDSLQELKFSSCKELVLVFPAEQESSLVGDLLPLDAHIFPLLQVLIIRKCPKLLGFPFSNHIISPDRFPKLQVLQICDCPEFFVSLIPMSWIESLHHVLLLRVKLLQKFECSKSSDGVNLLIHGTGDLHSIDQVLVFDKETSLEKLTLSRCPPLELKHLLMLTSLRTLIVENSVGLVGPLGGGQSDVEWQLHVEYIKIYELNGNTGEELTKLLPHLSKLSKLEIQSCKNIKKLVVGVDVQQTTQEASEMAGGEITVGAEEEVLLFPPHLCDSLRELEFSFCRELVLADPPTLVPGGGWLQALRSLQRLTIWWSPKFLSAFSFSCHIFPSSLQFLKLVGVEGMGTLEPLSNLSSLTRLELHSCGEDLKCQGLLFLITTGGQLNELDVRDSHRFFADWDPNPRRALEDAEGGEEQQTQFVSSTLQELWTDDIAGLLAAPVCRFLSFSLTKLKLFGNWCEGMERFSKEQEDALQLLSSLQELEFWSFKDLQELPAGLRNLTSLKILSINFCPAISSLPNDALSDSLEQYCRGLEGTIPKIIIDTQTY